MNPSYSTFSPIGVMDLLLFHSMERQLFNRLVQTMNKDPQLAKLVIALWLWLEEIGHYDLIKTIFAHNNRTIDVIFKEAVLCLNCVAPNSTPPEDGDDIPILAGLINEPINSRFFHYHRNFAFRGVARIMEKICNVIFGDRAAREVDDPEIQPVVRPHHGEGLSVQGAALGAAGAGSSVQEAALGAGAAGLMGASSVQPAIRSALNPAAMPFFPSSQHAPPQTPQDERTMFITLSRGYPLTREEIIQFFSSKWGAVVENLTMEVTTEGKDPLYGRMVLTNGSVISLILNGELKAKFKVRGRNLWARRYVPKS